MNEKTELIVNEINEAVNLNFNKSFEYAQFCSVLLRDKRFEGLGRKIIINILDNWGKINPQTQNMWTDLIEAAGFYPYLESEKNKLKLEKNLAGQIRKEWHKSDYIEDIYFHDEQLYIKEILNSSKNVIVSAPTSFGKSLLIEEIVASLEYRNIVIIQPTLALLDETRKKLNKYKDEYKIIVRTSQRPSGYRNLFLLTAERVMEYKELPLIDFLVLDEFYKISSKRDDERSDILNNAVNLLLNKHKSRFYMLGPNIDGISRGFAEKYNAVFFSTDYSLVENKVVNIYKDHLGEFGTRGKKKQNKELVLFKLLKDLAEEQTIIYCSSPFKARHLAKAFTQFLSSINIQYDYDHEIIPWIEKYVSENWTLIDCLKQGVGFHDGALQKHITSSIVDYFNSGKLKFLFCTSTIIEGVNTTTKNVIFYDNTKGNKKPIDFFDYSNIKGRSGRMMSHYVGKVYNFNEPPMKEQTIIDIPFFEQNPVSDEVLIQLDKNEVKNKDSDQYQYISEIPYIEKELFKSNGVSVKGQTKILEILKNDFHNNYHNMLWSGLPSYDQLTYILTLAWNNLLKPGETTTPMTLKRLVKVTYDYGINKDINLLVQNSFEYKKAIEFSEYEKKIKKNPKKIMRKPTEEDLLDEAIRESFQILRHWFQYKVPKWLSVMNTLQEYVCSNKGVEAGNYMHFASQIENDFIRPNLSILLEYGVPSTAVKFLEKHIPEDLSEDHIIDVIKTRQLDLLESLLEYEKRKIRELF